MVWRRPYNGPKTLLQQAVARCRRDFVAIGLFSVVINALQLTTSLYMMQVYDRVLGSHSRETLFYLSCLAVSALLLLACLESVRSRIAQRVAAWVHRVVAPESFVRAVESQIAGLPYRTEALRDLASVQTFLSSAAMLAIFDVPWFPIYVAVIFMLAPALGAVALIGAIVLLSLTILNELLTAKAIRNYGEAFASSQRVCDSTIRNAEVIDAMGMSQSVLSRWHSGLSQGHADQETAGDIAGLALAGTKFIRMVLQIACTRRWCSIGAGKPNDRRSHDSRINYHGPRTGAR